jgi:hypothetical protein
MARKINLIPGRLRRKVPSALLGMADEHVFLTVVGLGLAILFLYGPVVGMRDHNGLRYLLGPLICAFIPAAWYIWRPLHPYSGYRGRWNNLGPLLWKDKSDPECARLVEVFRSQEARRFLTVAAQQLTIVLFVPLAVAAFLLGSNLNWSVNTFFVGLIPAAIGTWIVVFPNLIAWGLRVWASEVAPRELEPERPHRTLR